MEDGVQPPLYRGMDPLPLSHCINPDCDLKGATLKTGRHEQLTADEIAAYRRGKASQS